MIACDVLIIGAGPVGLFQVFELGLLGLNAHVVDSAPQPGGQCTELYPDKPIYDIPAIPVCGARELIGRLREQIQPFAPVYHLNETVVRVEPNGARFIATTASGAVFDAGAVVIAGGLGAFAPRKLPLEDAALLEGNAVLYKVPNATEFKGQDIVVSGGGDSALDWAIELCATAASVVLVHRTSSFRAAPATVAKMRQACDDGRLQFLEGEIVGLEHVGEALTVVRVSARSGLVRRIDASRLLVFWGLHPALGPIATWGLTLDKNQVVVDTATFQTSIDGIYAVGDINTYPGKRKLILSGFHEATLAAFAIKSRSTDGAKVALQYTTTSPALHRRLGVAVDVADA